MQEYLSLVYALVSDRVVDNKVFVIIRLKEYFLKLHEEMDINLFYLSKQLLINECKNLGIDYDDLIPLEKEIHTMDEFITRLQIPRVSFVWNRIESTEDVYRKESDLYYDIRKILLNKDKYVRNYKPIINYYLSLIIEALESAGNICNYADNEAESYQFAEIIRLSKLMLSDAPIMEHKHISLTMRNDPSRIIRITEKYK